VVLALALVVGAPAAWFTRPPLTQAIGTAQAIESAQSDRPGPDWQQWVQLPGVVDMVGPRPDGALLAELGQELTGSLAVFEQLLAGRDYLFGEFSVADCAAFPFLKYALIYDETDTEEFHLILREFLALDGRYPKVEAWIRRVDERPRA